MHGIGDRIGLSTTDWRWQWVTARVRFSGFGWLSGDVSDIEVGRDEAAD
jgi:hypothetical protein